MSSDCVLSLFLDCTCTLSSKQTQGGFENSGAVRWPLLERPKCYSRLRSVTPGLTSAQIDNASGGYIASYGFINADYYNAARAYCETASPTEVIFREKSRAGFSWWGAWAQLTWGSLSGRL